MERNYGFHELNGGLKCDFAAKAADCYEEGKEGLITFVKSATKLQNSLSSQEIQNP